MLKKKDNLHSHLSFYKILLKINECYLCIIFVVGKSDIHDWVQTEKDNKRE